MERETPGEGTDGHRLAAWIASLNEPEAVVVVLKDTSYTIFEDDIAYRAACRRLLALQEGVEILYRTTWTLPRITAIKTVLVALWQAERHHPITIPVDVTAIDGMNAVISSEIASEAAHRLRDLLAESVAESRRFHAVLLFAQEELMVGVHDGEDLTLLARLLSETGVSLTRPLLDKFSGLVVSEQKEYGYQTFLAEHPVFLDPLAAEVYDRHRLGDDLVTDYVVRRHDSRYVAVEIEKPQDPIFTKSMDLSATFNHAFGQLVDFLGWVDSNVAYARTKLPGIETPGGLLVIGLRKHLSSPEVKKLRRFCDNSKRIDVVTFDDLWARADSLYRSIRYADIE